MNNSNSNNPTANETPHFDISAAVIRQLGEELVSDEVTAMMELIKNSYDADADWVNVEINTKEKYSNPNSYFKDQKIGFIIIQDDGFGMSDQDILDYWMKISLSSKKKFKALGKVTPKERTPLGEKGVGRLSTQKLGNRLELFTGKMGNGNLNHVAFDWSHFEDDISLTAVPVHIDQLSKKSNEKGTTLIISDLRDPKKWEGTSWDKFRGQISQMIFPFKEKRGFNVYLKLNGDSVDLDELSRKVRRNAVSTYSFNITEDKLIIRATVKLQKLSGSNSRDAISFYENRILPDFGKDFFDFLTDPTENKRNHVDDLKYSEKPDILYTFKREIDLESIDELSWLTPEKEESANEDDGNKTEEDEIAILAHPGPFDGEIDDFYFQDTDAITNAFSSLSEFKRIVQNQVGIRVFRDGFGIKPYGIDGYDWLNLSGAQTSGGSFYGLRPGNVVGYISISARDNKNLKEKTDREGFQDNPYSRNFKRIMDYVVNEISEILEGTRRSYNEYRSKKAKETAGIKNVADSFDKLKKASQTAKKIGKQAEEVRLLFANVANRVRLASTESKKRKQTPEEEETTKLLVEISKVLDDAQNLLRQVEEILEETKKLDEHVEFLQPQIDSLEEQLSEFSELAGLGLTAEAMSHELSNIVERVIEETDQINKKLKGKQSVDASNVNVYIEYIRSATKSFRKQLSHLAPSLKYVRESKEAISTRSLLAELKEYYVERFNGKIQFETQIKGRDFSVKMNKGKIVQILDNLIINSEYWLNERKKSHPRFKPVVTITSQEPFIRVSDNGMGIEPSIQDRIFQPFISAKPKTIGRGLGLFIVQQLLESDGCDILLLSEKNNYGRKHIFQINLSSVIES